MLTHNAGIMVCNEFPKFLFGFELDRRWTCLLFKVAHNPI